MPQHATPTPTANSSSIVNTKLNTSVIGDILDTHRPHPPVPAAENPPMSPAHAPCRPGHARRWSTTCYGPQKKPFGYLTEALDQLEPGEVYSRRESFNQAAMWGEILTATSQQRGAVGAVVDGYHRDTAQVLERNFPVFSWGTTGRIPRSARPSPTSAPRSRSAGCCVTPGDLVIGDIDGVLIVPQEVEAEVIEAGPGQASLPKTWCAK